MRRSHAIMTGTLYLSERRNGFAWTSDERNARRFDTPNEAQTFIDMNVDGDLRVVAVD